MVINIITALLDRIGECGNMVPSVMFKNFNQKVVSLKMLNYSLVLSIFLQSSGVNFDEDIKFYAQISWKVKARHFSLASFPEFKPLSIQEEESHPFIPLLPPGLM